MIAQGFNVIVMLDPLSVPVVAGVEETTRILYPPPVAVPAGIEMLIVPVLEVEFNVPILVGLAKLPAEFDSCAV